MALVRCDKHNIPYNEANPRGCPACAQEAEGSDASVMQELARVSRTIRKPDIDKPSAPVPPPPKEPTTPKAPQRDQTLSEMFAGANVRRTPAPMSVPVEPTWSSARTIKEQIGASKVLAWGIPAAVVMIGFLFFSSGPNFVVEPHPADFTGTPRPLPVEPGFPIEAVFSALGTQPPQPNPDSPRVERYSYGEGLAVDAFNGAIYALTYSLPNRSWRGILIGATEQRIRGALTLLGTISESGTRNRPAPRTRDGYLTYPSVDDRPAVQLQIQVRPPNGCFDVIVDMSPKILGLLIDGDARYAVVAQGNAPQEWVSSRVRVINRAIAGPYARGRAC